MVVVFRLVVVFAAFADLAGTGCCCCWAVLFVVGLSAVVRVVFSFFPAVVTALTCGTLVTAKIISDATRVMIKNLSNFFTNR